MKQIKKVFLFFIIVLQSFAQNYVFAPDTDVLVTFSGNNLQLPFSGGINSAQINKIDLNNDSIEDLVIFDRHNFKLSTFLASGNTYKYAPEYENYFPKIINWLVLADYNCDGKKDIFTASLGDFSSYISIYKNIGQNQPKWQQVKDGIKSIDVNGLPNIDIIVGFNDFPAINDIDDDGDLDILVFNGTSGIEFHKNNSKELYNNCDSLNVYEKYHSCWGKVYISGDCENILTLNQSCATGYGGTHDNQRVQHGGSNITVFDIDNDGIKDILVGDILCPNLTLGFNKGTNLIGSISGVNGHYPVSYPVTVSNFPNSFVTDVDFDGLNDLLISPNLDYARSEKNEFANSVWYYKNIGTNSVPSFSFQQNNFLQSEMIDVGENASPALADYDNDGDLDLFIGNRGQFHGTNYYATIYLFKNIGTKQNPAFTLENDDYLGISTLNLARIKPKFADINNDGAIDIYFYNFPNSFANSDEPKISYILNSALPNQPFNFSTSNLLDFDLQNASGNAYYQSTSYDSPTMWDINNDGLKDLIIGKENGSIHYLQNIGTFQNPIFKQVSSQYGGFGLDFNRIFCSIELGQLNSPDTLELVKIDQTGILNIYPIHDFNSTKFIPADSNFILNPINSLVGISKLASYNTLALADINGDTLQDMIIGTGGGGILIYKNLKSKIKTIIVDTTPVVIPKPTVPSAIISKIENTIVEIFPNPSYGNFQIYSSQNGSLEIYDVMGKIYFESALNAESKINVNKNDLKPGVYFVKFIFDKQVFLKKIAIQ